MKNVYSASSLHSFTSEYDDYASNGSNSTRRAMVPIRELDFESRIMFNAKLPKKKNVSDQIRKNDFVVDLKHYKHFCNQNNHSSNNNCQKDQHLIKSLKNCFNNDHDDLSENLSSYLPTTRDCSKKSSRDNINRYYCSESNEIENENENVANDILCKKVSKSYLKLQAGSHAVDSNKIQFSQKSKSNNPLIESLDTNFLNNNEKNISLSHVSNDHRCNNFKVNLVPSSSSNTNSTISIKKSKNQHNCCHHQEALCDLNSLETKLPATSNTMQNDTTNCNINTTGKNQSFLNNNKCESMMMTALMIDDHDHEDNNQTNIKKTIENCNNNNNYNQNKLNLEYKYSNGNNRKTNEFKSSHTNNNNNNYKNTCNDNIIINGKESIDMNENQEFIKEKLDTIPFESSDQYELLLGLY